MNTKLQNAATTKKQIISNFEPLDYSKLNQNTQALGCLAKKCVNDLQRDGVTNVPVFTLSSPKEASILSQIKSVMADDDFSIDIIPADKPIYQFIKNLLEAITKEMLALSGKRFGRYRTEHIASTVGTPSMTKHVDPSLVTGVLSVNRGTTRYLPKATANQLLQEYKKTDAGKEYTMRHDELATKLGGVRDEYAKRDLWRFREGVLERLTKGKEGSEDDYRHFESAPYGHLVIMSGGLSIGHPDFQETLHNGPAMEDDDDEGHVVVIESNIAMKG